MKEGGGDMAGVPITDRGAWMQVGEGRIFYPLDPRAEEVNIDDIATALSRIIRYNGHSDIWITVAQHCCQCVTLAKQDGQDDNLLYALLMHDAAEAYVGDMIRPIKAAMPEFQDIEDNVYAVIEDALDIPRVSHTLIKHYDNRACAWEKRDFFKSSREWPNMPKVGDYTPQMVQWNHTLARSHFMDKYWQLACIRSRGPLTESLLQQELLRRDTRDWRDV